MLKQENLSRQRLRTKLSRREHLPPSASLQSRTFTPSTSRPISL